MALFWKSSEGGCKNCGPKVVNSMKLTCERCKDIGCYRCIGNTGGMCKKCKSGKIKQL
jgi:hypothetical protein